MKRVTLKLKGMHCTSCAILIDTALEELPGVKAAKSNYVNQIVEVEFDPSQVTLNQIYAVIKNEGYDVAQSP